MAKKATIYHNPKCSTSRQVLAMIEAAGYKPEIFEYLKTGWTKKQLNELFAAAGVRARQALGLLDPKVSDAKLLDAMVEHPILVERPFVVTAKGTLLARPKERVQEIL
jgi:arsenate reductase (glutaredoxin)